MQRSFSIVMDEDADEQFEDEQALQRFENMLERRNSRDLEKSASKIGTRQASHQDDFEEVTQSEKHLSKIPSAGPSGRQTVLRSRAPKLSSESDLEESDGDDDKNAIPGEYDPKEYEHLDVSSEIKEVFQYITKYIPQTMSLDHKFKPFVPEFLPAVGDIDAFLKVIPPTAMLSGESFASTNQQLGLAVLDEPAANQSDAALLHLQLRAESVTNTTHDSDVVVKKIDNVEKNTKIIDKWIKDISALHKSKSFPAVRYTEAMPDLDELMQEWPEDVETKLNENQFPQPKGDLNEYIEEICSLFQIPAKNKIQALHLFFSLYAAVKSSQLFKNSQLEKNEVVNDDLSMNVADQLLLE